MENCHKQRIFMFTEFAPLGAQAKNNQVKCPISIGYVLDVKFPISIGYVLEIAQYRKLINESWCW